MDADPDEILLLDTSAAIALLVEDHEAHTVTLSAVRGRRLGLAGHAWFEAYSVLTRLPGGLRRSPADVADLLARDFPATEFLAADLAAGLGPGAWRSWTSRAAPRTTRWWGRPPGSMTGCSCPAMRGRAPSTRRSGCASG